MYIVEKVVLGAALVRAGQKIEFLGKTYQAPDILLDVSLETTEGEMTETNDGVRRMGEIYRDQVDI